MMRFRGRPTDSQMYALKRQRLRIAREVIAEGGSLKHFAERVGISRAGASLYLERHSPVTLRALSDNHRYNSLDPIAVLERLRVVVSSRTKAQAAKTLGITASGLSLFLSRYAPDGVQEALEEYEFTYGVPLLEETAA